MPTEQKAPFVRIKVLHGTDADRRLATDIDDSEIHVTTDQFRIWLGQGNLLSGNVHHVAANQAARLNLKNTAPRGCWNGDTCKQTDTGKIYQCISNEGTGTGDWLELTDHNHTLSNITDAGTAAGYDVPWTGDAASYQVVLGNDSRLTDSRPPTAHNHDDLYYTESEINTFLAGKSDTGHTHVLANVSDAGTAAGLNVAVTGDAAAGEVVKGNDSRLVDSRNPLAHNQTLSTITDAGTAAGLNVAVTGDAAVGEVVKGNDSRLTDSRNPLAHNQTLSTITDAGTAAGLNVPASGDAAAGEVVKGNDSRLTDSRNPLAHNQTLSTITDAGSAASRDVPSSGDATSTQCVLGNDSRLGTSVGVNPIGGIIGYDSTLSGASYPSSVYARCEGNGYPDFRNKFLRGNASSSGGGGDDNHDHPITINTVHVSPCSGGGYDVSQVTTPTGAASDLPAYANVIYLIRYA